MDILHFTGFGWSAGLLFAAPLLWAALDRFWGSDIDFKGKKLLIAAVSLGFGFVAAGLVGLAFGVLWFIYRTEDFKGGAGAPETSAERQKALAHHALILPFALGIAAVAHLQMLVAVPAFALYVAGAVSLAVAYGQATLRHKAAGEGGGKENVAVELARGALFGLAVLLSILASQSLA